jgi:hypothetical protein
VYLFAEQLETLGDWFAKEYPEGTLEASAGYTGKGNARREEYNIVFSIYGQHFASTLEIPKGWESQPVLEIAKLRGQFLDLQQQKIAKAIRKVKNGS